jgi:nucleoside-diphosphate-sugar epimerase
MLVTGSAGYLGTARVNGTRRPLRGLQDFTVDQFVFSSSTS